MTVGKKIKYFRKARGLTQAQLAELTGIHPVSIRKYETDKAQPLTPQLKKIADVLGVSYYALADQELSMLHMETIGDLMGLLIRLCKSNIIIIKGQRQEDGFIEENTCTIDLNPLLGDYLHLVDDRNSDREADEPGHYHIQITDRSILKDLLRWERLYDSYKKLNDQSAGAEEPALKGINEALEILEMQMQSSAVLLDRTDGIGVKMVSYPGETGDRKDKSVLKMYSKEKENPETRTDSGSPDM